MSELAGGEHDLGVSEETLQTWKRLGVISTDGIVPDRVREFLDSAHRSTATEEELLEFMEQDEV